MQREKKDGDGRFFYWPIKR